MQNQNELRKIIDNQIQFHQVESVEEVIKAALEKAPDHRKEMMHDLFEFGKVVFDEHGNYIPYEEYVANV